VIRGRCLEQFKLLNCLYDSDVSITNVGKLGSNTGKNCVLRNRRTEKRIVYKLYKKTNFRILLLETGNDAITM
jgi:hypothetical protein